MILVDSSVWIDYFRGAVTRQTDALDAMLGSEFVATGDIILLEVLQGFSRERDLQRAKKFLTALKIVELGGVRIALRAAENYRTLRALPICQTTCRVTF
ncbi:MULTISPECIES: PIN domain-containing protein [unclassified Undibacterium]|uniref:type II toxin-antitoxin system VapC family toxin n=1 Tax=unclassified Undibacterium TaxID=2630295 RepID=UPI002AC9DE18|nr:MULTISPECIES: PIN domain-containing protein [unclassified Undibacterium]MEB0140675.1 PIN domain-containing protein [Undibacterium sp. CCC2.1]MEB0173865.1 PIN domain-containing protein [Undibacterium sp. CCC1.1]MEB0177700.1 PIN domain-containing protein [Undibacterium sp. CCC3.4]MEB0216848.1 PIN domain-containing protein [Undibacterium sp. 5I2]WPX44312.1 PIN domain-containing protein [Undibacterium sp. CCC3.4]